MQKDLTLIGKDGYKEVARLIVEEIPDPFIELQSNIFNSEKIKCERLYHSFQDLHKQLDSLGLKLLCMGYRYDVRPSGIALSMGHGTLAYLLKLGEPATQLANIFDPTDEAEAVVSYEEQKFYYMKWINSLQQLK
jgi:hypothetical protein